MELTVRQMLTDQQARYPLLTPQDLLKAVYQRTFGCGHFVSDPEGGLAYLRREAEDCPAVSPREALGGGWCRVHLSALKEYGLAPETLFRIFALSAAPAGEKSLLEAPLAELRAMAGEGLFRFSAEELERAVSDWRAKGCPACHHSEPFRSAYRPAYRLVREEYAALLPLLGLIDRLCGEKERVLLAIEGGSAAGKSTLAERLSRIYADSAVFHMDDFFLRPEQRTPERFAEPGGNVDRERFLNEVLLPISRGEAVSYRRFDCGSFTILPAEERRPARLNLIEGAYSLHPALSGYYDASVFLSISPELQRARIEKRNTPEFAERFFTRWIPLEQSYFDAYRPQERCTLTLEAEA